jgi:subtilisin family serine protease
VAGTIGAKANNGGVVGVNHQVRIMPLKFLSSSGSGSTANAILAVDYAAANGATISNNSWGGGGFSQGLLDAINRANTAGQLFVAAAGNNGVNNDTTPHYPSSYNAPNVVAVAATDRNDGLASFSNYGATSVDLAAPGVSILSTVLGSNYGSKSGTSMATPHVAGMAALLKSEESALTPAQVKDLLLQNVDTQATHSNLSGVSGKMVSGGRLNAAKALAKLTPPPPDTKAPSVSGVTPTDQASGVATNAPVTAMFDEPMDKASLNTAFTLVKQDTMENVGTSVTYDAANNKATLNHPDLEPGTKYTATVTTDAKNAAGNALTAEKVWSFTTTAVAAPTNLTAARSGSGSSQRINLTWTDNSSNETNFAVERCTGSSSLCASQGSWSVRTSTLAANTESYADSGLSRRTTYTYRVKATNSAGSSQYSNTASATTTK